MSVDESDESDAVDQRRGVASAVEEPPFPEAENLLRRRRLVRPIRGLITGATAVAVTVVLGITAVVAGHHPAETHDRQPVGRPGVVVGAVPVWWDTNGLHRGDVVEQTPVVLVGQGSRRVFSGPDEGASKGALALVRSGAVYLDPATGHVWFHPWGGEPRIVGHDSLAGPGGDPNGDTAAWFEGLFDPGPGELVVYDTATGREISRTPQVAGPAVLSGDHHPTGNTFLQVSAERVVWSSSSETYSHDVTRGTTSVVKVEEFNNRVEVLSDLNSLVVRVDGGVKRRYPDLEGYVRLSPSGNYILATAYGHPGMGGRGGAGTKEPHGAVIVDTRTGKLWREPKDAYSWIAWSYGDIAMVQHPDDLLACDGARRTCERLPAERPVLVPTN